MSQSERSAQPSTMLQQLTNDGLQLAYCRDCRRHIPFGAARCGECGRLTEHLAEVSGRGRVTSWTVVHRVMVPSFPLQPPYVVALIVLDEGPTVPGAVPDVNPGDLQIGDIVQLRPRGSDQPLLMFERGGSRD